ncbi:MAG: SDR family oxidoreductase [bacterium]
MKLLITGVNGMVGSALINRLKDSSHQILATGRGVCRLPHSVISEQMQYVTADITSINEVYQMVHAFSPDLIIHGAAMTQVDDCELNKALSYSINVDGTGLLIAAAEQVRSRFCYLSTDFVFDGYDGPYKEEDITSPINYYGKTKELAEQMVSTSKLSWSIARTVLLYGKSDHIKRSNFIYWVKDNLEAGRKINVVNDQLRTPTYIPDFVDGILKIMELGAEGIYHISGEDQMSPFEMANAVADHLGLDKSLIHPVDASTFSQIGKRPLKTGFSIEKSKREIGYSPTSFKESLALIF